MLSVKQHEFCRMVALLIQYGTQRGYEFSFGDAWALNTWPIIDVIPQVGLISLSFIKKLRQRAHSRHSFHYKRLAIDLNLFKNGKWLRDTNDHIELGEFWESMGGTWGGRWGDGNHYSLGEDV